MLGCRMGSRSPAWWGAGQRAGAMGPAQATSASTGAKAINCQAQRVFHSSRQTRGSCPASSSARTFGLWGLGGFPAAQSSNSASVRACLAFEMLTMQRVNTTQRVCCASYNG